MEASRREQLQETRVSQLRGAPRQSWGKGRSKGLAKSYHILLPEKLGPRMRTQAA